MRSIYTRPDDVDRTHRRATIKFLEYIHKLGHKTEAYLQKRVADALDPSLTAFASADRQALVTFRDFWSDLHGLVQTCRDADTLHIPVVLIEHLEERLAKIPGLRDCLLVISHTSELMYFEYPRSDRRDRAKDYADIIPGAPQFPAKLALIAMPYSQEASLFSNLLICHEIGHFVFEELKLRTQLVRRINTSLVKWFPNSLSPLDRSWCFDRLMSWAEEIFCDRFAIGLVGPAFSFAYIEFFDLIGVEDEDKINEFSDSHPSDSCRLHEHAEQLKSAGWEPFLDQRGNSFAAFIRRLQQIPSKKYVFTSEQKPRLAGRVLKAYIEDVKPLVRTLVKQKFGGRESRFGGGPELFDCVDAIQKYLSWGVVPATLMREGQPYKPDPILLINAAFLFQLEKVPSLMKRIKIEGKGENDLRQREKWSERVEQWTIKALEDLNFVSVRRKPWQS